MRILLSNHALQRMGGSETWTHTMYERLSRDHTVHVYTPKTNTLYPFMDKYDGGHYDLGILNHTSNLKFLRDKDIDKIIFTSHGVIPGAERPTDGADHYVAVSEEVQSNLASKGYESTVIRNPINLELHYQRRPADRELKKVLYVSNNPPKVSNRIARAVKGLGLEFEKVGGGSYSGWEIAMKMNHASTIISLGRGAYEAMATQRNVIVMDYNGSDGIATPESLPEIRKNNCSGRRYGLDWNEEQIQSALLQYDPNLGLRLRAYINENNNVNDIAEQYLCL